MSDERAECLPKTIRKRRSVKNNLKNGARVETNIAVFRGKEIRKTIHNNEWWFVITDLVSALTDSADPSGYIKDMRRRDKELSKGWGQIATPLWENYLTEPESRKRLKS